MVYIKPLFEVQGSVLSLDGYHQSQARYAFISLCFFLKEILKKGSLNNTTLLYCFFYGLYSGRVTNYQVVDGYQSKKSILLKTRAAIMQVVIFIPSIPCQRNR